MDHHYLQHSYNMLKIARFSKGVVPNMNDLVREIPLSNGLTVRFFDATRRYFGDYHQVRVKICLDVPLSADLFDDAASYDAAVKTLGPKVQYLKEIEHQGVPTLSTSEMVQKVIQQFINHSLPYFQNPAFPRKFVHSQLNRRALKSRSYIAMHHSNG